MHSSLRPLALAALLGIAGCDRIMTSAPPAGEDLSSPLEGRSGDLNGVFVRGDEHFARVFTVAEGLGPLFNNLSCEGCHPGDGRGTPAEGFFRFSRGTDLLASQGGPQHQDKSIPGVPLEALPPGVDRSFRLPPPVFGMGLIEAIPVETILANEDPEDRDGDGISGRANWVQAPDFVPQAHVGGGPGPQLGRFSRKAQVSSLVQQVSAAYQQDLGITNDFLPEENPHAQAGSVALGDLVADPEIPAATVLETVMYVRLLSPPARGEQNAQVAQGETAFGKIGCASCHLPAMNTGAHLIPQLSQRQVNLYSDLLLHDMGPGLADNRPDGDASGSEWRTAPLWGTRLVADFLGGQVFYLHDGRATSLDQAIRLHGGEAEVAKEAYLELDSAEQQALLAFINSL